MTLGGLHSGAPDQWEVRDIEASGARTDAVAHRRAPHRGAREATRTHR
ncbi:hypothetical protein [Streptomyces lavenduligriseus]|uniref:Uncharacterized protein n=1 Tax=Streptomyces lavenduligriseus TaxID=67315 RepID=A0ABT0P319_9ACTN|nr:hypothetical protein [Streptomyces lavenduligriseus]MCL3998129.1 hypothetical protein [Streptomyces lavenduligriseus]